MPDYKCLIYEVKDAVATLTLNRPERLNALGDTLRDDLYDAVLRASQDPDIRVLVVTGAGKGFCAGGDVKAMNDSKEGRAPARPLEEKVAPLRDRVLLAMRDASKPVIAAVNGAAAGAGMNLALGCDIRLASTAAKFTQAFVKRGLHPDWGGTYFLPRLVGMAKACELIFTGEIIDAQEALRLGIVNAVYAPEELMPAAYELARKIAAGPPVAIRLAKRALYHSRETDLRGALEFETFAQNVAPRPRTRRRACARSSRNARRRLRAADRLAAHAARSARGRDQVDLDRACPARGGRSSRPWCVAAAP